MAYPLTSTFRTFAFTATMADISTSSSVYISMPFRGRVLRAYVTIENAITSADSTLTASVVRSGTATAITGMTGTAANVGSGAGVVYTLADATALNDFVDGDAIKLTSGGESSTTCVCWWTLVVKSY